MLCDQIQGIFTPNEFRPRHAARASGIGKAARYLRRFDASDVFIEAMRRNSCMARGAESLHMGYLGVRTMADAGKADGRKKN